MSNVFVRLFAYYAIAIAIYISIPQVAPSVAKYVAQERARYVAPVSKSAMAPLVNFENLESDELLAQSLTPARMIPVVMSMIGAFAISYPVALTYLWTRKTKKSTRVLGQMIVVMPVAIALVVFLVKESLALAFSLAGIVAAVRFRTTLSETPDAVYMLVAIGIGLAAGVQLLMVAWIASMIFVVASLLVNRYEFGSDPKQLDGFTLVDRPHDPPADGH